MLLSGASWAALLLSLDVYGDSGAARMAVAGVVLIGVTLVTITFGVIAEAMIAFIGSFILSISIGNLAMGAPMPWMMVAILIPLLIGPAIFSLGWAKNIKSEAKLKLDHRQLSARLLNALEDAHYLAHHDPLTGLSNRRAFFAEYDVNLPEGNLRSFVTIDLDNFKEVNDQLGHKTGDALLLKVASVMTDIRDDLPDGRHSCVRLGGDEFVLVLDQLSSAQAQLIAEKVRARIKQIPASFNPFKGRSSDIHCSASIGVAQQHAGEELDQVLSRSDDAMYISKSAGRNQVTLAA
ncbi:GGDEF domain-containing protein [Qipengyuania sp. DGS5-3]|uniref:GGDEF domain-containing protein n=1 Tax=Qipengyuania sp. DGS5-3 TaxID=3349632 RepID=UPI0036D28CD3